MLKGSKFHCLPNPFYCISFNLENNLTVLIKENHSLEEFVITSHTDHDLLDFDILRDVESFSELDSTTELDRCCPVVEGEAHCSDGVDACPFNSSNSDVSEKRLLFELFEVSRLKRLKLWPL